MSKFLSSLETDPADQRFNKAAIYLRALVFTRLSDDHIIALALLHELRTRYARAYDTEQLKAPSAQHCTQKEALQAHLQAQGLPDRVTELEPHEAQSLIDIWETRSQELPCPFDKSLQTLVAYAKTQLKSAPAKSTAHNYQVH